VLPDGVKCNTIVSENGVFFQCVGVERMFSRGGTSGFSKSFLGAKSGEICFLPLETEKTAFFAEIFKFLPRF